MLDIYSVKLTQLEVDYLYFLAKGLQRKEIASAVDLADSTVKAHLKALYEKLHVRNGLEATSVALAFNIIDAHMIKLYWFRLWGNTIEDS